MSGTPPDPPSEGDRDTDQLDALEAEWTAIQPLGLEAQEEFLPEVLGPALWAATGDDLHALNRFFESKWELFENEIYRELEVRRRQRDDRVNDLEAGWLTLEDDAALAEISATDSATCHRRRGHESGQPVRQAQGHRSVAYLGRATRRMGVSPRSTRVG